LNLKWVSLNVDIGVVFKWRHAVLVIFDRNLIYGRPLKSAFSFILTMWYPLNYLSDHGGDGNEELCHLVSLDLPDSGNHACHLHWINFHPQVRKYSSTLRSSLDLLHAYLLLDLRRHVQVRTQSDLIPWRHLRTTIKSSFYNQTSQFPNNDFYIFLDFSIKVNILFWKKWHDT